MNSSQNQRSLSSKTDFLNDLSMNTECFYNYTDLLVQVPVSRLGFTIE